MSPEDLNISNKELLEKFHLMSNGKLKRSAVMLFYSDPSVIQNGSYVKVGRFTNAVDLQYQDTIEDSLIKIADKVIDLIYLKYLKAKITYEHDRRVETYPYARIAIREAVYNAIIHNCYMFGTPIQIRVENEAIIISNQCFLPEGWTAETLMKPHHSKPYNPNIANVFYRAGYIENWGRGVEKICDACKELGENLPKYEILGNGMRIHFSALKSALIDEKTANVQENVQEKSRKDLILSIIRKNTAVSLRELAQKLDVSSKTIQRDLNQLKRKNVVYRIGSDKGGHWKLNK